MTPPSASPVPSTHLPRELEQLLRRLDRRVRAIALLKGAGILLLATSLGMALGMAADFFLRPTGVFRWLGWGIWVICSLAVAFTFLLRPLAARFSPLALASLAERAHAELGESLTTTVSLVSERSHQQGSLALIQAHTESAVAQTGTVCPARVVSSRAALRGLLAGLTVAVVVAIPIAARPDPFLALCQRFTAPWLDLDPISRFSFRVEPGDKTLATGSDLKVHAELDHRFNLGGDLPTSAFIEWSEPDSGTVRRLPLILKTSGTTEERIFEGTIPGLEKSIQYRIIAGSERSRSYAVATVTPPQVASLVVTVDPPAYTKRPKAELIDPKRMEVTEGSLLGFVVAPSKPVDSVKLLWPDGTAEREVVAKLSDDQKTATASILADAAGSFPYAISLGKDAFGIAALPDTRRVVVKPDAPPTLSVQDIAGPKEAKAEDVLGIVVDARDDFAISSVEFHYQVTRGDQTEAQAAESGKTDARLQGLNTPRAKGEVSLPLRPLKLQPGDRVRYMIRVADNRPAPRGANVVWSEPFELTIVDKAEPILARRDRMNREQVKARIDEIKAQAIENRRETEQLRYAADASVRESKAWSDEQAKALADRETAAAKVRDALRELARDLQFEPAFRDLARPAEQVANVEAEAGRERLEHAAKKTANANDRLEDLRQADSRLGAVQTRLEEMSRKFDALAKLNADRQALRDLAAKEDDLADQLANARPDDLDHLLAEQMEAKKDLDALLSRSPELRAGVLAEQAKDAASLAEKAKALAERQRQEARQTSDLAQPNDKLKDLADEQRRLEDDARRLALDVDDPLAENGRARLNVEPIRAAAEPIERGDINNGRSKLEEAERELRRLARDVADVRDDPKALARRLANRQNLLAQRVAETVSEVKGKPELTPAEKADLAAKLKPLADSQRSIAKLAEAIKVDDPSHANLVKEAARLTSEATNSLLNTQHREADARQTNARNALNRLADALPDQRRRQEPARQKLELARRVSEEVHRDLARHLAETAAKPWQPEDPVKRANDLAQRLKPLAAKLADASKALREMKPDAPADPQRQRAEHRMKMLAESIENLRKDAETAGTPQPPRPIPNWQVAGPFPANARPPFDINQPIDFKKPFTSKDPKAKVPTWRQAADGSRVNLGQLFGEEKDKSAFAVAEIKSETRRVTELQLGSDDTLTVWLNGKQIHNFQGNRNFSPGSVKLKVELQPGVNRLVARIGNKSDRWEFGATMTPPPPAQFNPVRHEALRETMPQRQAELRASIERLGQKMSGTVPADDLAEELAAEQKTIKPGDDPLARVDAVKEQRRLSTALRNLVTPDAPLLQAEAVRLSDRAADMIADANANPEAALKEANEAAQALANRLTDRISQRKEAEALVRAERGLSEPDAPKSPSLRAERQKAIADRAAMLSKPEDQALETTRVALKAAEREARMIPTPAEGEDPLPSAELSRKQALKSLERLASQAPDTSPLAEQPAPPRAVPDDPELRLAKDRVEQSRALAQRQRRIREKLQAIVGDRVEPQEALRDEAADLGSQFAALRDESRETSPRSQGQAAQAADLLANHAPKIMDQGAAQLAEGKPREAKETQRRAAETLERAAQMAEDLASSLKADFDAQLAKNATPPTDLGQARSAIADSTQALAQARQANGQQPEQAVAQAQAQAPVARRAADSLRAAAAQGHQQPAQNEDNSQGEPGGNDPKSRPIRAGVADLAALQAALEKKTGRKWGELPGHLRSEILQRAQGKYRDDYARLIQLYFQEIASDSGENR